MEFRSRFSIRCTFAWLSAGFLLLSALSGQFYGCASRGQKNLGVLDSILVNFSYVYGEARSVCISGDFNGWSKTSDCMRKTGKTWNAAIMLPPGRYQYAFVIDDQIWRKDPHALLNSSNGFGGENSVLIVY